MASFVTTVCDRRMALKLAGRMLALGGASLLTACGGAQSAATSSTVVSSTLATSTRQTASSAVAVPSHALTSATASSAAPAAKGVTLQVSSWLLDQPMTQAYDHLIAAYAKVQPDVKVTQQRVTGDYASKLTALLAAGTAPDLAETNWQESQPLGEKAALKPLDTLISQDKIAFGDYVQVALELGRWPQKTGKYYAWYTMFATSPLFYNTALFQAAGQSPPDDTWTWDKLVEVAQTMTKPGATPAEGNYGFSLDYFTRTLLYSYGWDFTSPDLSRCLLDQTGSVDAMQFWQDLMYKSRVSPAPAANFAKGEQFGPFSTKRMGMVIDGSYMIQRYRSVPGLDWDIAVPPKGPQGRIAVVKGAPGHSLPAQSPHPEQAWAFLSWWIKNQTPDLIVLPGNLPSRLTALSDWQAQQKKDYKAPVHIELVYDIATKYGKPVQVLPNNTPVKKPYYTERGNILANKEDAKTGMVKACQQMTALLQQAQAS